METSHVLSGLHSHSPPRDDGAFVKYAGPMTLCVAASGCDARRLSIGAHAPSSS